MKSWFSSQSASLLTALRVTFSLALALPSFAWAAGAPSEVPATFQNILFDARGARGGNGDVAASYLFAVELLERYQYTGELTLLVNDEALHILSKLTGRPVTTDLKDGRIHLRTAPEIATPTRPLKPYDAYFALASATGELPMNRFDHIPMTSDATYVVQTVFGNTENESGDYENGLLQIGLEKFPLSPAGFAPDEQGIYYDSVAHALKHRSKNEIRTFLSGLAELPESRNSLVEWALNLDTTGKAELGLVYGISNSDQKRQLMGYLERLAELAESSERTFVLVSPLPFQIDSLHPSFRLADRLRFVDADTPLPTPKRGHIYFVKSGSLNHPLFVGLLAYSTLPPVIAGDGSLSAALPLGIPFMSTRVEWNANNVAYLSNELSALAQDREEAKLYRRVFSQKPDLTHFEEIASHRETFRKFSEKVQFLSDRIFTAIELAREVRRGRLRDTEIEEKTKDRILKTGLLKKRALQLRRETKPDRSVEAVFKMLDVGNGYNAAWDGFNLSDTDFEKTFFWLLTAIQTEPSAKLRTEHYARLEKLLKANRTQLYTNAEYDERLDTLAKAFAAGIQAGETAQLRHILFEATALTGHRVSSRDSERARKVTIGALMASLSAVAATLVADAHPLWFGTASFFSGATFITFVTDLYEKILKRDPLQTFWKRVTHHLKQSGTPLPKRAPRAKLLERLVSILSLDPSCDALLDPSAPLSRDEEARKAEFQRILIRLTSTSSF